MQGIFLGPMCGLGQLICSRKESPKVISSRVIRHSARSFPSRRCFHYLLILPTAQQLRKKKMHS